MRVTKKMLKNGYSGPGELDNAVAEFTDGKRNGLGVDESIAGEYKDDVLNGYAINKITKNINRYEDGVIVEQLVTRYMNGDIWVGTGDTGILIRLDGTTSPMKPVYVENPVYIINQDKQFKRISMVDLKMRKIDFWSWYCPIYKANFSINPVGEICSGVCANIRHVSKFDPHWKTLDKLVLKEDTMCRTKTCFCDADLLQPKAQTKELYDYFNEHNQFDEHQLEELPVCTDDDEILAMGRGSMMN